MGGDEGCYWSFKSPSLGITSYSNLAGGDRQWLGKGSELIQRKGQTCDQNGDCTSYWIDKEVDECKITAISQIEARLEANYGFFGANLPNVNLISWTYPLDYDFGNSEPSSETVTNIIIN